MSGTTSSSSVVPGTPYIRSDIQSLAENLASQLGLPSNTTTSAAVTLSQTTIYDALQSISNSVQQSLAQQSLPLVQMAPDFETTKGMMLYLLSQSSSWTNILTAGGAETLAEMIATMVTLNQMAIERGVQESNLNTSVLESSVYAITNMFGVRVKRKTPAYTTANLTNTGSSSVSIPVYTQFTINGVNYFNRAPLTLAAGETQTGVTLWQGTISQISFISSGQSEQIFEFGNSDWAISDSDVMIQVGQDPNYTLWTSTGYNPYTTSSVSASKQLALSAKSYFALGLWEFGGSDKVFYQDTNAAGNVEVKFGNGEYGAIPQVGQTILVTVATTLGAAGNSSSSTGTVSCPSINGISGTQTSASTNGADEKPAASYRFLAPALYAAKYGAVTTQQYNAVAIMYPGVLDANFQGQSTAAGGTWKGNLQYMMNMQYTLITNETWTATQVADFESYMQSIGIANIVLVSLASVQDIATISGTVYCSTDADLTSVQNESLASLDNFFEVGPNSLGYSVYQSDVYDLIAASNEKIAYITGLSLTCAGLTITSSSDLVIDSTPNHYITLGTGTSTINLTFDYTTRGSR